MSKFAPPRTNGEKMNDLMGKGQIRALHGFELGLNANAVINWWMLNFLDKKICE
jgi:hypothetical protein